MDTVSFRARRSALVHCWLAIPALGVAVLPDMAPVARPLGWLMFVAGVWYLLFVLRSRVVVSAEGVDVRRLWKWKRFRRGDEISMRTFPVLLGRRHEELVLQSAEHSSRISLDLFPDEVRVLTLRAIAGPS